jgi:H+-transporting ATPase
VPPFQGCVEPSFQATMTERRISYAFDVENGDRNRNPNPDVNDSAAPLEEYTALNRYISTARDRRRGSTSTAGDVFDNGKSKKKPWWAFWRKSTLDDYDTEKDEQFVAPDDWVETDIRHGLKTSDIEFRRKKSGWNELTTEHVNLFLQFIGYFRGPILYGEPNWCPSLPFTVRSMVR